MDLQVSAPWITVPSWSRSFAGMFQGKYRDWRLPHQPQNYVEFLQQGCGEFSRRDCPGRTLLPMMGADQSRLAKFAGSEFLLNELARGQKTPRIRDREFDQVTARRLAGGAKTISRLARAGNHQHMIFLGDKFGQVLRYRACPQQNVLSGRQREVTLKIHGWAINADQEFHPRSTISLP